MTRLASRRKPADTNAERCNQAPTAIVSYTMAVELKGDERLASATIALSVFTSLTALVAIMAFFPT